MLYKKVLNTIKENSLIIPGMTVIAALSGGADSICLTDILMNIKDELGFTLECAHLNHNLRGDESDSDESFVRKYCKTLGLRLHTKSVDVKAIAVGRSIEEAARDARYAFFDELTDGKNAVIATAHTQNDNVETFFINLLRGSGARGLCGIPIKRQNIIRPMLNIKRSEIEAHLKCIRQSFCADSTNADTAYLRNFLRNRVIPMLSERQDVDIYKAIETATENLKCDCEALDAIAHRVTDDKIEVLTPLPDAVLFRVLSGRLKNEHGITLDRLHFKKVKALLTRPNSKEQIRGDVYAKNSGGRLYFTRLLEKSNQIQTLSVGENRFNGKRILIKKTQEVYSTLTKGAINCDKISGELYARTRHDGDIFECASRKCTTHLKKLLINDKVPQERRDTLAVICDDIGIVYVEGYGADKRVAAKQGNNDLLSIKILGDD